MNYTGENADLDFEGRKELQGAEVYSILSLEKIKESKMKLKEAQILLDKISEEFHEMIEQNKDLEFIIAETAKNTKALKEHLSVPLDFLSKIREKLYLEFSYSLIQQATDNFSSSRKISEDELGTVYKGTFGSKTVSIKKLNSHEWEDKFAFYRMVDSISKINHPNLTKFIGSCSEASVLICEDIPSESLEDHLNSSRPLEWEIRLRIIAEICCVLAFLHSQKPYPLIHGNLNAAAVLLDADLRVKFTGIGLRRNLSQFNTNDSEATFGSKGSDIYYFGIIILRLLTRLPADGIAEKVQQAVNDDCFHKLIDPSIVEWPFDQTVKLSNLGLRCCPRNRTEQPDLLNDAWRMIAPMIKLASVSVLASPFSSRLGCNEDKLIDHFKCPISLDIMKDPYVAADGFTYEAEYIRKWFSDGHNTSPMTREKLQNLHLVQNRFARALIEEWHHERS